MLADKENVRLVSIHDCHAFSISYYPAVVRNLLTLSPGFLAVLMITSILRRQKSMISQYQQTVVFLTYGGWLLSLPIIGFNMFMAIVIPWQPPFLISTFACSIVKQVAAATMNSGFAVCFYVYMVLALCVGIPEPNDECPMYIDIDWVFKPLMYFGYLTFLVASTAYFNLRTLMFLLNHIKQQKVESCASGHKSGQNEKDQLHLSIGLVVQASTVCCTFGSSILFMLLFQYEIYVPAWLSTITNVLSSLSTFLNPLASAIFIRSFRLEMIKSLLCLKKGMADRLLNHSDHLPNHQQQSVHSRKISNVNVIKKTKKLFRLSTLGRESNEPIHIK